MVKQSVLVISPLPVGVFLSVKLFKHSLALVCLVRNGRNEAEQSKTACLTCGQSDINVRTSTLFDLFENRN